MTPCEHMKYSTGQFNATEEVIQRKKRQNPFWKVLLRFIEAELKFKRTIQI